MSKRHLVRFSRLVILLLLLAVSTADGAAASATTTTTTKTTQEQQKQPRKQQQNKEEKNDKPNIVIILIDDMGFNDVSFHGSNQILTPNIDALAYNGIILNRHYVPNLCTPSRATLLTGKYPIHTGTHHFVILNDEPWGLPLGERLMPELFRDAGYATNLVGKWHLGFWRKELTPTMRGFDHHYGYLSGYIDYYDHTLHMLDKNYSAGLDFRRDLQPWPEANGTYATELFTQQAERIIREHDARRPLFLLMSHLAVHTGNEDDPMQAPPEEVEKFMHIADPKRRIYAGMVSSLDRSVGRTVRALAQKGILNNTIVLLYSDNGAPTVGVHSNGGSNFPFRGQKESPWEGALRSAGAIWSPLLKRRRYVSNQVVHAIDWLPTLASAAGVRLPERLQLDGVDVWDALSHGREPQPRRLLHVMDDVFGYSAFLRGDLKYVNGTTFDGLYDGWLSAAPPPDQVDPRAAFYVQEVLSSEVHRLLGALDAGPTLGVAQVEAQRQEATHRCPPDDRDPADPLFRCEPLVAACVFDLARDPCERFNLARLHPLQVALLRQEVEQFRPGVRPSARVPHPDPQCDPALHGGTWQWWDGAGGGRAASSGWTPSPHLLELLFLAVVCTWRGSATVF